MDNDTPTIIVQFTQSFTVQPPDYVDDRIVAEGFIRNRKEEILHDVIDPNQGEVEVLTIDG